MFRRPSQAVVFQKYRHCSGRMLFLELQSFRELFVNDKNPNRFDQNALSQKSLAVLSVPNGLWCITGCMYYSVRWLYVPFYHNSRAIKGYEIPPPWKVDYIGTCIWCIKYEWVSFAEIQNAIRHMFQDSRKISERHNSSMLLQKLLKIFRDILRLLSYLFAWQN